MKVEHELKLNRTEMSMIIGCKVYCAFVDTFDKVYGSFVKLLKKNVSLRFVYILRNWHSKLSASVMWNGFTGPVLFIEEGGILSPLLFSVYIDDLLNDLHNSGYGVYLAVYLLE